MKTMFMFFATILISQAAFSQSAAEVTCRAQAKEVALQTYSSCITEARNSQVDDIRKNYQKDLANLKAKYDNEIKKMAVPSKQANTNRPTAAVRPLIAPIPVKGIAKKLPERQPVTTEALPIQTVSDDDGKVFVAESTDTIEPLMEEEAAESNQAEFIDMPVE